MLGVNEIGENPQSERKGKGVKGRRIRTLQRRRKKDKTGRKSSVNNEETRIVEE